MFYNVVSSGSKGNATLVFSHGHVIQLDFGIAKKNITLALAEENMDFDSIEAFFITHTHSDHASNLFNAPIEKIYIPQPKVTKIDTVFSGDHLVKPYQTIFTEHFKVTSVPLSHDCPNTMGYIVSDGEETLAYITDTGFVPEKNFELLKNLNYYIFESNHDPEMLYESKRPDYLIKRIISDTGHLSNVDSAYYLSSLIGKDTKEVVLAHLSDECNTPSKAMSTFEEVMQTQLGYLPDVSLKAASDRHPTKGGNRQ